MADASKQDGNENECFRVKVSNIPAFAGAQQLRKFIMSTLDGLHFRKLKFAGRIAFISLKTREDAELAVKLLGDACFKKAPLCATLELRKRPSKAMRNSRDNDKKDGEGDYQEEEGEEHAPSAKELVTPLAEMEYAAQLELKFEKSKEIFIALRKQMAQAGVPVGALKTENLVQKILPSPVVHGYRNKCEFAIGYSSPSQSGEAGEKNGKTIVVGFIGGKMANKKIRVLPVEDCTNLSSNTRSIVRLFEQFVRDSGEDPFDEFSRTGFWKMLTVRDFLGDCMIIVTVYPHPNPEFIDKVKKTLVEKFLPNCIDSQTPFEFNISSIYWQELANTSDERLYEHLAGTSFVYASLGDVILRISPSTFFQTNTYATAVLYDKIGDLLGLPTASLHERTSLENEKQNYQLISDNKNDDDDDDDRNTEKRRKIEVPSEDKSEKLSGKQPIVVLDICCGAGSIGLCLMQKIRKAIAGGSYPPTPFGCMGVDLVSEAIRDAKKNAVENGFAENSCVYIDGQAEIIFNEIEYHMPKGCPLDQSRILGIIDPPRAGVSNKVTIGCRRFSQLKSLAFVSCDPRSAMKNLVDLCRPTSRKYEGTPFRIANIQPVDMFPLTEHMEWIVVLER